MSKNKTNVEKLVKKFQKKKWVIDCGDHKYVELLAVLKVINVKWIDGEEISASANSSQMDILKDLYFEIVKKSQVIFQPKECYPAYHYRVFSYEEFLELVSEAIDKDHKRKGVLNE